jgi:hypothetical protein
MGEETMSDVEKRIEQWREGLAGSESLGSSEVRELESHLREEMEHLKTAGLSEEEAFLIASHRLGGAQALEAEFEKVNSDRRFLLHLSWMIAGALAYVLAGRIATGISHGGTLAAVLLGGGQLGATSLAVVTVAIRAAAAVALFLLAWACVRRWSWGWLRDRLQTMSLPRVILLVGGLIVVNCALILSSGLFSVAMMRCLNMEEFGEWALVSNYAHVGWSVLAPILAVVLAIVLHTRADRCRQTT